MDPDYKWKTLLRRHFVHTLIHAFPKGLERRKKVRECLKKEPVLEFCKGQVIDQGLAWRDAMGMLTRNFIDEERAGTGRPYDGNKNYENFADDESQDGLT